MRFVPLLVCLAAGCAYGPELDPVSGTVSLPDGNPATGCTVEFSSDSPDTKGMNARGVVQADGSFTLSTRVGNDEKP